MPRAPITYQTRPQKWTDETLNDALNSFQYGILKALNLLTTPDNHTETLNLPNFTFTSTPETHPAILNNTVNHGEPYPAPFHKKWLRNRGRLSAAATSFTNQGLWPTPIITASAHRTGTDLCLSPKVVLAMIGMAAPTAYPAIRTCGLSPELDKIAIAQGMEYEDHGVRGGNDRKFPSDPVRELVRIGRRPGADLMPFAQRILLRPLRSLLLEDPSEAYQPKEPVPASWLYKVSLETGVPVTAFVRYAEHEYDQTGGTYMDTGVLQDLIGLIYEFGYIEVAKELEATEWILPEGDYY